MRNSFAVGIACFLSFAANMQALDIVVTSLDDTVDGGDGVTTLREAIIQANGSAGDDSITFDSQLESDMAFPFIVLGGQQLNVTDITGKVTIDASALTQRVIVDGNNLDPENASRVFGVAEQAALELDFIQVTGGKAPNGADAMDGTSPQSGGDGENGGGIHNEGALVLRNSRVVFCEAGNGGAGGSLTSGVGVAGAGGNGGKGGGIYSEGIGANLVLIDSEVATNDAGIGGNGGNVNSGATGTPGSGGIGGDGGGLYCDHAADAMSEVSVTIEGSFFTQGNNFGRAMGGGGGIEVDSSDGSASGRGGHGGGAYFSNAKVRITDSSFVANLAGRGGTGTANGDLAGGNGGSGGGIYFENFLSGSDAQVASCLFWENNAGAGGNGRPATTGDGPDGGNAGKGGGLFVAGTLEPSSVFEIENSTFTGNRCLDPGTGGANGGGLDGEDGTGGVGGAVAFSKEMIDYQARLTHVTIVENVLDSFDITTEGGGVWEIAGGIDAAGSGVSIANSIISLNSASSDEDVSAGILEDGINLIGGDPLLDPLDDNILFGDTPPRGGPTQTMPPTLGSPAINGGGSLAEPLSTDQRGFARPKGGQPDLGAVEISLQPDAKIGNRANYRTHRINNVYRANAAGQVQTIPLRNRRLGRMFFSVENDGELQENPLVRGNRPNNTLIVRVFRLSHGRANVSGAIIRGMGISSWDPGDNALFRVDARRRTLKRRARGVLRYTASSRNFPVRDAVLMRIRQIGK